MCLCDSFDIAMLSCVFPTELESNIRSNTKSAFQNAANSFQKALISGIEENNGEPIRLINTMAIGTFPRYYRYPFVKGAGQFRVSGFSYDVSYFNLPLITNKSKFTAIKPHIKKWSLSDRGKRKVLIGYAMLEYVLKGLSMAKSINPNIITCLIVPDLPENMYQSSQNFIKSRWHNHMNSLYESSKGSIDCYALISDSCARKLNLSEGYIVLEGIIDQSMFKNTKYNKKSNEKVFLYTGGLYDSYGVRDMVVEFRKSQRHDIALHIYGDGPLKKWIEEISDIDQRVSYKGMISREECILREQEAYGLINPRKPSKITPYSFPSKVLEYLASGTPTLCYALEGIPDEYYSYLYVINEDDGGLSKAIEKLCEMDANTYVSFGQKAQEFVLLNKSEQHQTLRLLQLVEELVYDENKK